MFQCTHAYSVASVMSDSVTLQTVAHQAPLSVDFPRPEYWSGLPCLPPGDLPDPGIEPASLVLQMEPPGNPPCSRGCLSVPSWSLDGPGCLLLIPAIPGWLEHTFKIQVKGGQEPWLVAEPASSSPRNLCGHLLPPGLLTTPPDSQHSPTPRHIVTLPASLQTWAWLSQPRRWGSPLPSQRWSGCSG